MIGYAENLPFETNSFDLALLVEVLEHLEQPEKAVEELARVLKVGGQAIVSMPFAFRIHGDPLDFTRWTEDKLRLVSRECGLEVLDFQWLGSGISAVFDALQSHLQRRNSESRLAVALTIAFRLLKGPVMKLDSCTLKPDCKPTFSGGWVARLTKVDKPQSLFT